MVVNIIILQKDFDSKGINVNLDKVVSKDKNNANNMNTSHVTKDGAKKMPLPEFNYRKLILILLIFFTFWMQFSLQVLSFALVI